MADETSTPQASPAAKKAGKGQRLVARLLTAGADDKFLVGEGFELTHAGVEASADQVEMLLEIANENGVAVSIETVQEGDDK